MRVDEAVMVTVELDFGTPTPSVADALRDIERRYAPRDGAGRTFAILDAYGEMMPDGKLHLSMHVSSEKAGGAELVYKRTGKVLWRGTIAPDTARKPFSGKELTILLGLDETHSYTVDGSVHPKSILVAPLKEAGVPVSQVWKDGEVREMVFIYSACGCPVKVKTKRIGNTTVRVSDQPVIFPDDPQVAAFIAHFMGWS